MFKAANGHYYIAFEQYKKAADAGGIAVAALGGSASVVKIKVGNMWVLELDADYKPLALQYYEKDGSNVSLPAVIRLLRKCHGLVRLSIPAAKHGQNDLQYGLY